MADNFLEDKVYGQAYRVLTGVDQATNKNHYDKLSFWTDARDVEVDSETGQTLYDYIQESGGGNKYASGTLQAGQSSVTIQSSLIKADSMLDIYVPIANSTVSYTSITDQVNGSVTIGFPPQSTNMEVRVVCHNMTQG